MIRYLVSIAAMLVLMFAYVQVVNEVVEPPFYNVLAAQGQIVSEEVVESHPVASVSMHGDGDEAVYRVEKNVDGAVSVEDYPVKSTRLDLRVNDGFGQRVDDVEVVYRNYIWTNRAEYHRLYIGS